MDDNERSRHLEVFLGKGILKICSKLTGEHRAVCNLNKVVKHSLKKRPSKRSK